MTFRHTLRHTLSMLALATASLTLAPAVQAADYDPPIYVEEAPEYVPVEVGSGWYLRGDVSYSFSRDFKDRAIGFDDSLFDNNLVGLGFIGPVDTFSFSDDEMPYYGSIGFGYHFNDLIRADVTFGVSPTDEYSGSGHLSAGYFAPGPSWIRWEDPNYSEVTTGTPDLGCLGTRTTTTEITNPETGEVSEHVAIDSDWRRDCIVSATASRSSFDGLANGYVDLGTYSGFTPYVGGGLGITYTKTNFAVNANCQNEIIDEMSGNWVRTTEFDCAAPGNRQVGSYSEKEYNLTYALTAGFAYKIADNASIDVGYQYKSTPEIKYYAISADGIEQRKGIDSHEIKVGLRYDLW